MSAGDVKVQVRGAGAIGRLLTWPGYVHTGALVLVRYSRHASQVAVVQGFTRDARQVIVRKWRDCGRCFTKDIRLPMGEVLGEPKAGDKRALRAAEEVARFKHATLHGAGNAQPECAGCQKWNAAEWRAKYATQQQVQP